LSTGHPALTPNWPASLPATLRAFPPPARRFRGAPVEQRAILARTFQKSQFNSQINSRATLRIGFGSGFPAFHRVRATMARRSTRGPLRGGEAGSAGRTAGIDRDVDAFSPAHGCAVEKPGPGSRTCRAGCPASAKRGVVFSWLLLFWTSKREVTRPPQEDESSSLLLQ
jgi:hypothetical protein